MRVRVLFAIMALLCSSMIMVRAADDLYIVSAAGYKAPVSEVIELYQQQTGRKINAVYGNMKMITTYISQSDTVSLIIGDAGFIRKSGIKVLKNESIGIGKLILVYRSGLTINSVADLLKKEVERIGIPDTKKAIYGKAAEEYFKNEGIYNAIRGKLIVLKTVPQVSSYLLSGSIDAGLINVTDYIKINNPALKSMEIDQNKYAKITIQAGLIKDTAGDFMKFITSESAGKIFRNYGL